MISCKLLNEVEQVAYITKDDEIPSLEMMGGELCINATLAFASTLGKQGVLNTSGNIGSVEYENKTDTTSITIDIDYTANQNIVLLGGIGFIITNSDTVRPMNKSSLSTYCKEYSLPAFGNVSYKGNQITPYIYVMETDSYIQETACGSGSIAFSILTGIDEVVQPTGETITIERSKKFKITAKVTKY